MGLQLSMYNCLGCLPCCTFPERERTGSESECIRCGGLCRVRYCNRTTVHVISEIAVGESSGKNCGAAQLSKSNAAAGTLCTFMSVKRVQHCSGISECALDKDQRAANTVAAPHIGPLENICWIRKGDLLGS